MRRVYRAIENYHGAAGNETLDRRMHEYDDVLYEWNDSLNVNLAVVGSHFGLAARDYLDQLYEDFRRIGAGLERAARQVRGGGEPSSALSTIEPEFEGWLEGGLNERVYRLGLTMMTQLWDGCVGRDAPNKVPVPTLLGDRLSATPVTR